MDTVYDKKENCSGCTACANICSKNAIKMKMDEKGFLYPDIDNNKCINCKMCINICPFNTLHIDSTQSINTTVYASKHVNSNVVNNSSSGGAFTAISDYILDKKGIVYGAAYDEKFDVCHIRSTNKLERNRIRNSKYVQSSLNDTFFKVKQDLINDKYVLFTGTPCQVAGLKTYLNDVYEKLICVDFACHGTPSPLVWRDYREQMETKYKDKIQNINFRSKIKGWNLFSLEIVFKNHIYIKDRNHDPYFILFLSDYILRPACYNCPYTNTKRVSDITIADFWGIETYKSQFRDNMGTSLIMLNTRMGMVIFNGIKENLLYEKSSIKEGMQKAFKMPSRYDKKVDVFWKDYFNKGAILAINKYGKLNMASYIKEYFMLPIIRKIRLHSLALNIYKTLYKIGK
jgi:Coenzyme F420-reducing hydrogenase, beta subunit